MSKVQNKTYIAKTFFGLEGVLAKELEALGATNVEEINRAVSFEGDKALMYKANLKLYTALKILQPFYEFEANNEDELYEGIKKINWSEYFSYIDSFKIDSTCNSEIFTHSQYVTHKVKDAIADQFKEKYDRRPDVNIEEPKFIINVLIRDNLVRLSWDCSGESLHKRGYRTATGPAPINEVLAAGLIKLSEWDYTTPLIDPMCGSGTILIEAALQATNTAPGSFRKHFAFMNFEDFDRRLFLKVKNECKRGVRAIDGIITGHDKSWRLLEVAETNIINAKMDDTIRISKDNFFATKPKTENGILIFNPPYGERLNKGEMGIEEFYENIGDKLKQDYKGFTAWIISASMEAVKRIGLKPTKKIKLYNGAIESRFLGYELFEGTHKDYKTKISEDRVQTQNSEEKDILEKPKPLSELYPDIKKKKKSKKVEEDDLDIDEFDEINFDEEDNDWMDDLDMNFEGDDFV